METNALIFTLKNGRTLTYDIYGDLNGTPVIFSHGLSDSRIIRNADEAFTQSFGVKIIAVDQPGVGGSTAQRGRTLKNYAEDIGELADHLELDKFAVAGHSGGGPHALALAAFLGDRVTHGVLASPIGPLDLPEFSKLSSKMANMIFKIAKVKPVLRGMIDFMAWMGHKDMDKYMLSAAKEDSTTGNTDTYFANDSQRAVFKKNFEVGLQQGGEGLIEMTEALLDWGFTLNDVPQHFDLFAGADDAMLTPEMSKTIANLLPDAEFHPWQEGGHYCFVDNLPNRLHWHDFLTAAKG